jgi:hypothetical protein
MSHFFIEGSIKHEKDGVKKLKNGKQEEVTV